MIHMNCKMLLLVWSVCSTCVFGLDFVNMPPALFDPGEDCTAMSVLDYPFKVDTLCGSPAFISGPNDGKRDVWLAGIRQYRNDVRNGTVKPSQVLQLDYKGVRSWIRINQDIAAAMNVQPTQKIIVTIDAQAVSGKGDLCLAFDLHDTPSARKVGWTGVVGVFSFSPGQPRHKVTREITVPTFEGEKNFARLIIGMDATHDSTPGKINVFGVEIRPCNPKTAALAEKLILESHHNKPMDLSFYDRKNLAWLASNFVCHFTVMYDSSFYDPEKGYQIDSFIEDGIREFGGYDSVLLWHAYPRIGVDDRNQFDFYRDMPGGLEGLRGVAEAFHARGIKVCINYNPWDQATRKEGVTDQQALANLVAAMDIDGIFLDTMSAASGDLREQVDKKRPGVVFIPEAQPKTEEIPALMGSWCQFWKKPFSPAILHHKWIEPRHMEYQTSRWKGLYLESPQAHYEEIENAFFNGSGMLVWENIFGMNNPWPDENRNLWRRASRVLHAYQNHFVNGDWEPFWPTARNDVYANKWTMGTIDVYTLVNKGKPFENMPILKMPASANDMRFFDIWKGVELKLATADDGYVVVGDIDKLSAIVGVKKGASIPDQLLQQQKEDVGTTNSRNQAKSVVNAAPVARTAAVKASHAPKGMTLVPAAKYRMKIEHVRRECGCYPDPNTPREQWANYLQGWDFQGLIKHDIGQVDVNSFFIDEAEVTNAEFKEFLEQSGYKPKVSKNFLKHWPQGKMPPTLANHPVVYVDIDDARAYAAWAGKRLPTEQEWQLAAQGTDGRKWPWGNVFDPNKCNTTGTSTMVVRTLPEGKSPYGCYHMSGNVYEWTESCRDDGHTRWCIIRGGSYYDPNRNLNTASLWYFDGGPRPCDHHAKFIRMWPGLDRCATIGFRCVVDVDAQP